MNENKQFDIEEIQPYLNILGAVFSQARHDFEDAYRKMMKIANSEKEFYNNIKKLKSQLKERENYFLKTDEVIEAKAVIKNLNSEKRKRKLSRKECSLLNKSKKRVEAAKDRYRKDKKYLEIKEEINKYTSIESSITEITSFITKDWGHSLADAMGIDPEAIVMQFKNIKNDIILIYGEIEDEV